jgi:hypothetical protein
VGPPGVGVPVKGDRTQDKGFSYHPSHLPAIFIIIPQALTKVNSGLGLDGLGDPDVSQTASTHT